LERGEQGGGLGWDVAGVYFALGALVFAGYFVVWSFA